ncbi:MAG: prepilin-type N-terminal cleavage/methylation domain-containing protein [Candidatus Omnitrophica bacterium]|nr:prepilin-type N-terminal cleavage/methylation domain-containing protein [Candidatus Omnitrophota bacterium]
MNKTGLSLTETLIVVIIFAIIASLALPMLIKTIEKARVGEAIGNLDFIRIAEKRYYQTYGTFSSDIDSLDLENPNDPSSGYFDYTIEAADNSDFTARAQRKSDALDLYDTYYYEISKEGIITSNGPLI